LKLGVLPLGSQPYIIGVDSIGFKGQQQNMFERLNGASQFMDNEQIPVARRNVAKCDGGTDKSAESE
jgi:hypothetical protein